MKSEPGDNEKENENHNPKDKRIISIGFDCDISTLQQTQILNIINKAMSQVVEIITPHPYSVFDLCRINKYFQYN